MPCPHVTLPPNHPVPQHTDARSRLVSISVSVGSQENNGYKFCKHKPEWRSKYCPPPLASVFFLAKSCCLPMYFGYNYNIITLSIHFTCSFTPSMFSFTTTVQCSVKAERTILTISIFFRRTCAHFAIMHARSFALAKNEHDHKNRNNVDTSFVYPRLW